MLGLVSGIGNPPPPVTPEVVLLDTCFDFENAWVFGWMVDKSSRK